jgi:hypothetical protein
MPIDTLVHVQIVLPNIDGLAVDAVDTSLNYETVGVDSTGVSPLIAAFFNTTATGATSSIAARISDSISRTLPVEIRYYDVTAHLDGSPHGAPFQVDTFTLAAHAGGTVHDLPNQCCSTLSYYSQLDPGGTTTGRHRGRMFLGPLTDEVINTTFTAGNPRLSTAWTTDCTHAFAQLAAGMDALANPKVLCVWSRKAAGFEPVIACFMENKVDTLRKRAVAATARTTLPV